MSDHEFRRTRHVSRIRCRDAVTPSTRLSHLRSRAVQTATVGGTVRNNDAPLWKRLSAIALTVVFSVVLIGGVATLPSSGSPEDHAPHAVATVVADQFASVMDHPHLANDSAPMSIDSVVIARVPRTAGATAALLLAVAVIAVGLLGGAWLWAVDRAPPCRRAPVTSGRQLLTRICITRC